MKELKFRVWDIPDEFMHESSDFDNCEYMCGCPEKYIVMQYTGFTDKAQNPIFEGDILEAAGGSKITVNDLAEFLIYCGRYEEKHGVPIFDCLTVMGNIYENIDN